MNMSRKSNVFKIISILTLFHIFVIFGISGQNEKESRKYILIDVFTGHKVVMENNKIKTFLPEFVIHSREKSSRTFVEVFKWYKDRYIRENKYWVNEIIEENIKEITDKGNPSIEFKESKS